MWHLTERRSAGLGDGRWRSQMCRSDVPPHFCGRRCLLRRAARSLLVLDGGCGLELKKRKALGQPVAYDLTLFSTAALRETPDGVTALHRDYIRAGCTVITTSSYAVTHFYLDKIGEGARVAELARLSVSLAKAARTLRLYNK